jgi:hypothetical protein
MVRENNQTPNSISDLRIVRERSRNEINEFLELEKVDHKLGSVVGWKAAFGARYRGELIAVCILSRPVSRHLDDGSVISISRLACLPTRPDNTGSWIIAKTRNWARLEGYDTMIAYAGVAGNFGTVYSAAGFELDYEEEEADGNGWQYRENRDSWDDYMRKRWSYSLQ